MFDDLISKSSLNYLWRHPWQFFFSVLGIILGVSMVVAIDLSNTSAKRAFDLSAETITGKATHHIVAGPTGLDDALYQKIKVDLGIQKAAPIIENYVKIKTANQEKVVKVLGLDLFAEKPFRKYFDFTADKDFDLGTYFSGEYNLLCSKKLADELGFALNYRIDLAVATTVKQAKILALIDSEDPDIQKTLDDILIMDIAAAQNLFAMQSSLSRIDLIIENKAQLKQIKENLPAGTELIAATMRTKALENMIKSFNLNLDSLSLLALLVGMFLIYNTMVFSVVQRRRILGLLRAIGARRQDIFMIIIKEAAVLGLIGSFFGLVLGFFFSKVILDLFVQSINDLYFVLEVSGLELSILTLLKALFLGILATVLSALVPAYEASRASPKDASLRSVIEKKTYNFLPLFSALGLLCLVLGAAFIFALPENLLMSFTALFAILLGCAFLAPIFTVIVLKVLDLFAKTILGNTARIIIRSTKAGLSRTATAIAALMLAISISIGLGITVHSFREAVRVWLDNSLQSDIYISPPNLVARRTDQTLEQDFIDEINTIPEIKFLSTYRAVDLRAYHNDQLLADGMTRLAAIKISEPNYKTFSFKHEISDDFWQSFHQQRKVLVSEPYAYHNQLTLGSIIDFDTSQGRVAFELAGIYYDYGSDQGVVLMSRNNYDKLWDDAKTSSLGLFLKDGEKTQELVNQLKQKYNSSYKLNIRSNTELKEYSLEVFDRTFKITNVLELLAVVIAFIGILSTFMALQLEKGKEIGVLRALGFDSKQIWLFALGQSTLLGVIAGLLAVPVGLLESYIMSLIINRRSFGWSFPVHIDFEIIGQAVLLAVLAGFLAGLYPAFEMSRAKIAQILREE